jgi:hypothetical protein
MEASSSENSLTNYQSTLRLTPEKYNLHLQGKDKLKPHKPKLYYFGHFRNYLLPETVRNNTLPQNPK